MFKGDSISHVRSHLLLRDVLGCSSCLAGASPSASHFTSLLYLVVYFWPLLLGSLVIGQMTMSMGLALSQHSHWESHGINSGLHLGRGWFPDAALFSGGMRHFRQRLVQPFCSGVNYTSSAMSTKIQELHLQGLHGVSIDSLPN